MLSQGAPLLASNLFSMAERNQTSQMPKPVVSTDGYIRLPFNRFIELNFVHVGSDCDAALLAELNSLTVPALAAGFSEWISNTTPTISVGWGWFLHSRFRRVQLALDIVRSNVMLIDAHGYDLGATVTSRLFGTWLEDHNWQDDVSAVLLQATNHLQPFITPPAAKFG